MACLRIFSSFVENPNDNNCFLLERRRCTGSSLDTNVNSDACNLRFRRVVGFSLHGWKMAARGPCAVGEGGGIRGEEDSEDDALKVTIEKSKKVLAMQKDLLQQIVERRNLVSSIKNDILNTKMDAISLSQNDGSLSNLDSVLANGELDENFNNMVSDTDTLSTAVEMPETPPVDATNSFTDEENKHGTSEHFDRKQNSRILSDTYAQSTEVEVPETPPVGGNYDYVNEQKELRKGEISIADALGLLREASSEPAQSNIVLPLLPEASETYNTYDEKVDGLAGANVEGMTGEHDVVPDEGNTGSPLAGENVMNVILVAAECAPWSKTGGLGDVAGALPKALARRGHRVMVVVPRYGNYSEPQETGVRRRYKVDGQDMEVTYFHAYIDNVDFVFLDSPVFRHHDNNIYGGKREDILKRMVLFCKAAVEVPWYVPCGGSCYGDGNLVFIANDWHTALLPVYLKAYYRDNGLMTYTRSVLVIHNIAHQGRGPLDDFSFVALPGHYIDLFKLYDPLGGEHFNIFAAGLKTADRVVTVSQAYAWELKTAEGGWGLHGIINENDWKLQGIVNGVDTKDWNPKLDAHLKSDGYTNYSLETLHTGKPQCKAALQRELGLPVRDDVPLIGFIGRLDHQKGVDLIAEAIPWMLDHDVQLVMLGSGRQDLEDMLRRFESEHHDRVRGWVGFSVRLSHRITAGADALLMPSRFEPCGLNQLYAMIYGTVPVVHAVGGLRDTVHPFNPYQETGLGWTFDRAEANRLIDALGNCLNTYRNYKSSWEGLQRRGMMQDLSWDNAAQRYEEVLVAAKYQW